MNLTCVKKIYVKPRKALAIPIVDKIDWNTLEHRVVYPSDTFHAGIFEWGFLYKEMKTPRSFLNKRVHSSEPYWYFFKIEFKIS